VANQGDQTDPPLDRRAFFRKGLFRLIGEAEKVTRPLQQALQRVGDLDKPPAPGSPPPQPDETTRVVPSPFHLLRPPGSASEADFASQCSRCGKCVEVCPAEAIRMDVSIPRESAVAGGLPYIDPASRPCVMCDSLACMNQCPSGALSVVARVDIDLGTAVWGEGKCTRSEGEEPNAGCQMCVQECPLGSAAIELVDVNVETGLGGRIEVKPACTGCGVCQSVCPTVPKAIVIVPKARRLFPKQR
jgi:ferredoxin-type protein NapG